MFVLDTKEGKEIVEKIVNDENIFNGYYVSIDKKNYYTEDEVEHLKHIDRINIGFTTKESAEYQSFCNDHRHKTEDCGAIGGKHSIIITSTGLGRIKVAKCNVCGETKDITDYDVW